MNNETKITATRDFVCVGDDCFAPHQETFSIDSSTAPKVILEEITPTYLPSLEGVGHRWICKLNGQNIAEITVKNINILAEEILFKDENQLHFNYISATY